MFVFTQFQKSIFNPEHAEFLRSVRSHPKVIEQLFSGNRISRTAQRKWYEDVYQVDENFIIFMCKSNDVLVGYVQFHIDSIVHRRCEVGYATHPEYWGKGFGKRMVQWSIKTVRNLEPNIHRLWLTVFPENEKAIKLYSKCGFRCESFVKDYVFKDCRYRDVLIMRLILE